MLTMSICMSEASIFVLRASCSGLDLDVDARRQVQLHERVQRLLRRLEDVEQALVRANLELLARLLVHVRRAQHGELVDLGRQRHGAGDAGPGALGGVHDLTGRLIQQPVIVGLQPNSNLGCHLAFTSSSGRILTTTPAPTVLPPSRIAKRRPSSQAIGVISSISRLTLSPGITISVPSGSVHSPVTSVVRK